MLSAAASVPAAASVSAAPSVPAASVFAAASVEASLLPADACVSPLVLLPPQAARLIAIVSESANATNFFIFVILLILSKPWTDICCDHLLRSCQHRRIYGCFHGFIHLWTIIYHCNEYLSRVLCIFMQSSCNYSAVRLMMAKIWRKTSGGRLPCADRSGA